MLEVIVLERPKLEDGMDVYRLVENCPPLDPNSSYCNLLQCSHFADTSVAAKIDDQLVGFISAYAIPDRLDTLFVWQVAVSESARGQGLGSRMITHLLDRPQCQAIRFIETSITDDNRASWALFGSLAKKLSADLQSSPWMNKKHHFADQHDSEVLVRVGPFNILSILRERKFA